MKPFLLFLLLAPLHSCKINKSTPPEQGTESTIQMNCTLSPSLSSTFRGKVTDKNTNEELFGAKVILNSSTGSSRLGAITDDAGNFNITGVPAGVYNLEISFMEHESLLRGITIKENSTCTADIKLSAQTRMEVEKPVIYLYPTQKQSVNIKLNYAGELTHTYPKYPETGWEVTAEPNGTLWDADNQEYYALFWEGTPDESIVPTEGFVVAGNETETFLEEKLAYLGLNRREANEFMMFWLPRLEDNPYNFIHFAGKEYEAQAELIIRPQPETMIRVMMLTMPLQSKIQAPLQDLSSLKKTRKGFTVVEWGGSVLNKIGNGI